MDFASIAPYWNGFFKQKIFFSYFRCDNCELLYAPIFFNGTQLEHLYGQMPPNMDEVPIDALRKTQCGYFKALKANSRLEGDFLEVGPDVGLFTVDCVRDGQFNKYWLFEPNRTVEPALRQVVEKENYQIIQDMFDFSGVPDASVSVAVMIHVLDHLLDPVATLTELRRKLRPGATLLLVTHDESSLLRHAVGWRWPAFCLQHPQIYNPRTMKAVLSQAGFDVVERRKTVNYFQISFLIKHLLLAFGIDVKAIPNFSRATVGLKLGNMLTLAVPRT